MKKYIYLLALLCFFVAQTGFAQKQNISVLYVGGSATMEAMGNTQADSVAMAKSAKERTASFAKFLKSRFKKVRAIDGKDYVVTMSNEFDVTIFDGKPTPIRPEIREYDEKGRTTKYVRPAFLPDDFDRPALCIADLSEHIGRSIGTKNDWYCLCLGAHAHNWKKEHPIFQGPFKVNIQSEMRATPVHAFEYAMFSGDKLPAQTEMWLVQTKSYETDMGYRIGLVSRPEGYLDSPETEIISSGVCAKSIDAVAIGRHANFFHWGFSAAPEHLTDAGKAALANSIVYISKFAGQHVIARKLNETISTRDEVTRQKFLSSRECWQYMLDTERNHFLHMDSLKKVGLAKRERGEKLTETEKMYADMNIPKRKEMSYSTYLQQRFGKLYEIFGEDASEYARYYEKNAPWFYGSMNSYGLVIDQDARKLGIANNDIRLLDTCISMLEKDEETELATRVLHRYTLCRFATPAEWRNWFDSYKDKMFFTESGGWLWLVNTQDRSVPGNDYSVLTQKEESVELPELTGETDNQNPVALSADIQTAADGSKEVVIRMKIHTGFHTYAQVASEDPFIPTKVKIELPDGYEMAGKLVTPAFKPAAAGSKTTIYEGDGIFRQKISGTGKGEVKCTVSYQCCDNSICFPPAEKVLMVTIP